MVQITTETLSPTRPESSLSLRMCQDDFHFERGDSSTNPLSQHANENHLLEASFAQFHLESNQIVGPIECTSPEIDPTLLTTLYGPPITDEAHCPGPLDSSHFIQPHVPLPPTNLALSLSHSQNLPLPFHVAQIPNPPTTTNLQTPSANHSISTDDHVSLTTTLDSSSSSHNPRPKKRFRKEIGKLGRNLRLKLFCGLFNREITGNQELWEDDIFIPRDYTPPSSSHNQPQMISNDLSLYQSAGFREANTNQLPQGP